MKTNEFEEGCSAMDVIDPKLLEGAKAYFRYVVVDPSGDWLSWWHCHKAFCSLIDAHASGGRVDADALDDMALNLAFYLASWGMYRGSSFLTRKDYTVHAGAIEILLGYQDLKRLPFAGLRDEEIWSRVIKLGDALKEYYDGVAADVSSRSAADGKPKTFHASDTLVNKVMLGTLACCPAYDRYFMVGERELGVKKRGFGGRSLADLGEICEQNVGTLAGFRESLENIAGHDCPDMKALDLLLWYIGWLRAA